MTSMCVSTVEWMQWHTAQTCLPRLDPHSTASGRAGTLSQQSHSSGLALAEEGPRLKPCTERQAIPGCKSPMPWPQIGSLPSSRASLGLRLGFCFCCTAVQLLSPQSCFLHHPPPKCSSHELCSPNSACPAHLPLRISLPENLTRDT